MQFGECKFLYSNFFKRKGKNLRYLREVALCSRNDGGGGTRDSVRIRESWETESWKGSGNLGEATSSSSMASVEDAGDDENDVVSRLESS